MQFFTRNSATEHDYLNKKKKKYVQNKWNFYFRKNTLLHSLMEYFQNKSLKLLP